MENAKKMKIIAVDTSLGTNFLLSACEDATIAELRGMIQKEHISCFPEHDSINVGALLVDYNQRQYRVTDHLLIGQVFRKCWNKIHAVVSLGSSRAGFLASDPESDEIKSLVDRKTGIQDGSLDKRPLVKPPEALLNTERKDLSADRQSLSDDVLSHACSHRTKALDNHIETAPVMMVNQDCWIDHEKFRCPVFSIEAPYTQPCSEWKVNGTINTGILDAKSKHKRRRHIVYEIPGEKQKQGELDCQIICESARGRKSSPNITNSRSTKEESQAKTHEESLDSLQPDTDQRNGLNGRVTEEHLANACEAPNNHNSQHSGGLDNYLESGRGHGENFLSTNTQAFVSIPGKKTLPAMIPESHHDPLKRATEEAGSPGVQKKVLESSWSEKGFSNLKWKTEDSISETSNKTGTKGCPELSAGNLEEGTQEATANNGEQIDEMDLSMGYPIKINDHTILLVASLSADVVPETQESQMESQDGINPGDERPQEQATVELLQGCSTHTVEPKEMEALLLPSYQDAVKTSTKEMNNQMDDLAALADKEENSKLRSPVTADQPSKTLSLEETNQVSEARILFDKHHSHEAQLLDANCSSDSHNISIHGKTKKYRRRKVSEIDRGLKPKDNGSVGLSIQEQCIQGGSGSQKLTDENAKLTENLIEPVKSKLGTCSKVGVDVQESSYKEVIDKDASDDVNVGLRDPGSPRIALKERKVSRHGHRRKRKKPSVGSCIKSSHDAGDHITEPKRVVDEANFRAEDGQKCMEDGSIGGQNTIRQEKLNNKEGAGKESDGTPRKKKKRRKEMSSPLHDHQEGAGINNMHSTCEGAPVDFCVNNNKENDFRPSTSKENVALPNALSLAAIEELKQGEVNPNDNVGHEQVARKKSKRKKRIKMDRDLEMCFTQEQDQNLAHVNVNDTESLSKDGVVKSASPEPSKEASQQEDLATVKHGFDVFEFESSETVNRQKENSAHVEAGSDLEADNLDKLCSVAVNFAEDETLNSSKMTTRKASRKVVHPRRWVTVLSERLTWNQASKSSSKQQHAKKKHRPKAKGTHPVELSSDDGLVTDEEAKEGSNQVIVDDGRVACPFGCGKLYTKKTSAYYRHLKMCSGA